jgi:ketosteroid isomerase-like protein
MAASASPIRIPITGKESISDPADPLYALSQFYRAFNNRDLALMQDAWQHSADVSLDHPTGGGVLRGWQNIKPLYERIFRSSATVQLEFFDYTIHDAGELFYAVGMERGQARFEGQALDLAIRTTRIFRFRTGRWYHVHHHGSIDDPQLLAAYQAALR